MRKPSKASWNRFYAALGAFYHAYTDMEHQLTCMIVNVAAPVAGEGNRYRVAKAIIGGQRMSPLKDTVKRLLRVVGAPQDARERIDQLFAHLGDIQFLRDRLAHHMTSAVTTDVWSNDDFAAVREIDKWQEFQFETSALVAATEDLRIMKWYIDPLFVGLREKADDQERSPFDAGAPLPTWQYKPSMLIRSRLKSGGKPQSRPRPPQSSGA